MDIVIKFQNLFILATAANIYKNKEEEKKVRLVACITGW